MFGELGAWQRQMRWDGEGQRACPSTDYPPPRPAPGLGSTCLALGWSDVSLLALKAQGHSRLLRWAISPGFLNSLRRPVTPSIGLSAGISECRVPLSSHLLGIAVRITNRISNMKRPKRALEPSTPCRLLWSVSFQDTLSPATQSSSRDPGCPCRLLRAFSPTPGPVIRRSCGRPLRGPTGFPPSPLSRVTSALKLPCLLLLTSGLHLLPPGPASPLSKETSHVSCHSTLSFWLLSCTRRVSPWLLQPGAVPLPGLSSVDLPLVSSRLMLHVLRETEPPISHLRASPSRISELPCHASQSFPVTWLLLSLLHSLSPSLMGEHRASHHPS